jgi:hypothetical protein
MKTKKGKGPEKCEQELQAKQDQPEPDFILLGTRLQDKKEGKSHEKEGDHPYR